MSKIFQLKEVDLGCIVQRRSFGSFVLEIIVERLPLDGKEMEKEESEMLPFSCDHVATCACALSEFNLSIKKVIQTFI